jgi:hypothetical protein
VKYHFVIVLLDKVVYEEFECMFQSGTSLLKLQTNKLVCWSPRIFLPSLIVLGVARSLPSRLRLCNTEKDKHSSLFLSQCGDK